MMPMKNASSETNSAASAMKLTTRLSALETGFGCATTDTPKISITTAKIQNSSGLMTRGTTAYFLSFHLWTNPVLRPPSS